ncbi:MAG TPA: hypothetical protein VF292_11695 [Rhodanobacteraceae bacterium]
MPNHPSATASTHTPDAITLAAWTWLACGCVLLGLTPLPLHAGGWGWSPLFWLLLAPASLLCARCLCARGMALPDAHARGRARAPRRQHRTACAVRTRRAIGTRRAVPRPARVDQA